MVLVTGGTGFLGSYIIKELIAKNYQVRAIRRVTSKFPFYIPKEILDKVELDPYDKGHMFVVMKFKK